MILKVHFPGFSSKAVSTACCFFVFPDSFGFDKQHFAVQGVFVNRFSVKSFKKDKRDYGDNGLMVVEHLTAAYTLRL